jgi:hypothetical protein
MAEKPRAHFSQPDLIIAATALCHGLTVVTRDRSDYDKTGVSVIDPWPLRDVFRRALNDGNLAEAVIRLLCQTNFTLFSFEPWKPTTFLLSMR